MKFTARLSTQSVCAPSPWIQVFPTVTPSIWTEPSPAPAVRDPGLLPAAAAPLLSQKWDVPMQKTWQKYPHDQQSETMEAATRGWQKKDQVFLSEQQLSSGSWSPAAIFNKMLLFNIVYCQQPMVIFSWTMHTQASKSLSLSLKLGRIFQELHNDITSLPLPTAQLSQQQHPLKYVPKALGTQSPRILCTRGFFDRKKWFAQTNPWYAY